MVGSLAKSHFKCFDFKKTLHSRDVFYTQPSLCSPGLSFELCSFDCSLFCRLFGFREFLNKQLNLNGNEYNGSVASMRYNSLFISLPFFTKQQREIATFCIFERT